jgi:hypothetical protein
MLRCLTKSLRRHAGRLVAMAYLACVVAPPLALTFADAAVAAHCLTSDHGAAAVVHVHADGTEHRHDHPDGGHAQAGSEHDHSGGGHAQADADKQSGTCCGLFCFSATSPDIGIAVAGSYLQAGVLRPGLHEALGGIGPFRIDRPPNVLASL